MFSVFTFVLFVFSRQSVAYVTLNVRETCLGFIEGTFGGYDRFPFLFESDEKKRCDCPVTTPNVELDRLA